MFKDKLTADQRERAAEILGAGPICDECLGRAFAKVGHGMGNAARGEALRETATASPAAEDPRACWVCGGLFAEVTAWAERAVAAAEGVVFDTYLFGVRLSTRVTTMQSLFEERFPTGTFEPLRHAFNREVGKAFEARVGHGTVDFDAPHLQFTVDLHANVLGFRILPVYILGRYRKLLRGIPQTRWPCRRCRGRGCEDCDFTGKQYAESIEELIAAPFVEAAAAAGAHLHGAGREDIDARMLGTGRPFVLELTGPCIRRLDLPELEARVNVSASEKVGVSGLRVTGRRTVALLKETPAEKTYRAIVEFDDDVTSESFENAVTSLVGEVRQRTPRRVAHRRADLVRGRRLLEASAVLCDARHGELTLRTEGGLYVKELVSGDEGRTVPSLASRLGVPARITALDVTDVHAGAFPI